VIQGQAAAAGALGLLTASAANREIMYRSKAVKPLAALVLSGSPAAQTESAKTLLALHLACPFFSEHVGLALAGAVKVDIIHRNGAWVVFIGSVYFPLGF
jgi:hypothetical protein